MDDELIRNKIKVYLNTWIGTTVDRTSSYDVDKHLKIIRMRCKVSLQYRKPSKVSFEHKTVKPSKGTRGLTKLQLEAIRWIYYNPRIAKEDIKKRLEKIRKKRKVDCEMGRD
jgi:hypothetical protein